MPSLSVVLRNPVAERRYLGFYAEVFLSASIFGVREQGSPLVTQSWSTLLFGYITKCYASPPTAREVSRGP